MRRAYVAGPYSAPTGEGVLANIRRAFDVAERLWRKGYAVFCPHMNTALMTGITWEQFLAGDFAWLECADVIVMLDGWEQSKGAQAEREFALAHGIRVATLKELEAEA